MKDPAVEEAARWFSRIDIAVAGIGSMRPSSLLSSSGNTFTERELGELRKKGAVGDICFQFIDENGAMVDSPLMQRVIGIDLARLKRAKRVVGVAGGADKHKAILASLHGGWINVLITDRRTAEWLVSAGAHSAEEAASMVRRHEGQRSRDT